ncbi:MAG: SEL1-like repeat protein [Campylobacterales bacterium]|nr:SEL1-like repeat protein [Campylobacterales bacterium]MBD3807666.1 SEL1-like repeat protein [Campylobacterota bacterium]
MDSSKANEAFNEDRFNESFEIYSQIAAKTKDSDAMYMLGKHYYDGLGVEKNIDYAITLWKKASKAGSLDAQYALLEICQTTAQCCKE